MSKLLELLQGAYYVCYPCGNEYGKEKATPKTFKGHCDICERDDIPVSKFDEYGYERTLEPDEKFNKDILKNE